MNLLLPLAPRALPFGRRPRVVRRRSDDALVLIGSEGEDEPPPDTDSPVGTVPGNESSVAVHMTHGLAALAHPPPRRETALRHWLTECYCLYTVDERRRVLRAEIHHPPWPLQPAEGEIDINTMTAQIGLELREEPLLHYSSRQDVVFWTLE